ncbi:MAG TPA: serpin family protein [Streptosporangiaceae bacterium]|nr:serpin family protein [Streptosporangiaceae bacterium]
MTHDHATGTDAARLRAAAAADDAFGADLYQRLGVGQENLVFSPASIAAALQMALAGARGSTAAQLAAALHLGGADPAEGARDGLLLLSEVIRACQDRTVTLQAPSTLWVQAGLPLADSFTGPLQDVAAAIVREADFRGAPQQARSAINELIAAQTAGKIANLLGRDAVTAATRLVLANAVYLKAPWASPFTASATRDAPFHPEPGTGTTSTTGTAPITVPMMHRTADLPYRRGDGCQAVLLPYKNSSLAMAIVLPDGPLSSLTPQLGQGQAQGVLGPLLAGAERQSVALAMPKFRQRTSTGLIPVLRQLGIQDAFTDTADFTGITTAERLHIGAVVHQAYIDVDEQGTEAAAATAVAMRPLALRQQPQPIPLTVDRPFLFAILDTATGLPLFLGQVTRPAPKTA